MYFLFLFLYSSTFSSMNKKYFFIDQFIYLFVYLFIYLQVITHLGCQRLQSFYSV